ncbi:MAG: hypothetical protein OMM_08221 [Candidatus Magnetoglobus multicellularis str. Araruama]|uniref:t-SNARE coiled-coil homology domain-containing protein n=1 Tax=Candidatus Magnetoglobus multicellularis str. Araruama TaxID=890399 RepID=A0A1V1P8Z2_9BACT|nr:MAG: hypothetical protein OMM_08221 [Candidatus Magnetoglobus multicellularis str. Araruama]
MKLDMDRRFNESQNDTKERFARIDKRFELVDNRLDKIISTIEKLSDKIDRKDENQLNVINSNAAEQRKFTIRMFTIAISVTGISVMGLLLKMLKIV